jgi:uroporphyrinogen-III synthase
MAASRQPSVSIPKPCSACPRTGARKSAGKRIAIFRGDGGRELLADTLRERGAEVDCITCYRRSGPSDGAAPLLAAWRAGQLAALTVSSSEGMRYLVDLLDAEGREFLQKTRFSCRTPGLPKTPGLWD